MALKQLERQPRLSAEIKKKLQGKGFSQKVIDEVIEHLSAIRFLNDSQYIEEFVQSRSLNKHHGKRKLFYDLMRRGADPEAVKNQIADLSHESQLESALTLLKRRLTPEDPLLKGARFLQAKGFESSVICEACERYFKSTSLE